MRKQVFRGIFSGSLVQYVRSWPFLPGTSKHVTLNRSIWTWWLLFFSFSRSWKYPLIAQQRRINCSHVFTQRRKIFLIVFAILSHAMTSILIILHGVSWFKKLSLPAVSVKRFSGAILGKSNYAFKCCIFRYDIKEAILLACFSSWESSK